MAAGIRLPSRLIKRKERVNSLQDHLVDLCGNLRSELDGAAMIRNAVKDVYFVSLYHLTALLTPPG